MTRRIIVMIGVFVLAGAILFVAGRYRPPAKVLPALATAEQVIRLSEMMGELLIVHTAEYDRLQKKIEQGEKEIKQLRGANTALEKANTALASKVDQYAAQLENVPDAPVYHPEETEICQELVDAYVNITATLTRNNGRLQAIVDNQALIIANQADIIANKDSIIAYKSDYINEFETLMKQYKKKSTRNAVIGVGLGIAIGLIL